MHSPLFFWHFSQLANINISRFHANFCKFGFTMSGAAKKIKSLFKSSIPVRRDDMWDRMEFGFLEKNSPRLHRAPILWMNKIYSHNGLSVLRPLDRIFDIWHEVTGVQLEVWSVPLEVAGGPFSPGGFIEWWEIRNCGLKKGDPARNSGSRQAPIGGFTGRAKHFVNSEILTTSETMTFCQNKNNRSNIPTKGNGAKETTKTTTK